LHGVARADDLTRSKCWCDEGEGVGSLLPSFVLGYTHWASVGIYGNTKKHDYGNKHFTYHYGIMKAQKSITKSHSYTHPFQICFLFVKFDVLSKVVHS